MKTETLDINKRELNFATYQQACPQHFREDTSTTGVAVRRCSSKQLFEDFLVSLQLH